MELKLNRTRQLLVCAVYLNLLGDHINTTKKNTDALIDASRRVELESNTEKTKCPVLISPPHSAGQN
jgi:hypothetical protein